MDLLKGKKIMVWTFMGNTRMYNALHDYGDRISQIGLFSFKGQTMTTAMERIVKEKLDEENVVINKPENGAV